MRKFILFLLCYTHIVSSYAQLVMPQCFSTYFSFSGDTTQWPKQNVARGLQTDSSGVYCFGNTVKGGVEISMYMLKYAYDGSPLWKKLYRFPGNLNYIPAWNNVIKTAQGFLTIGVDADTSIQDSAWVFQPFLLWADTTGDSLRMVKHIDSLHDRTIMCTTQAIDKSILAAGVWGGASRVYNSSSHRYNPIEQSLYLVKYDSVGNIIWEKNLFPVNGYTYQLPVNPYKIAQTADGGILICGNSGNSGLVTSYGHFFAKFDSLGNFLWCKRYPYNNWFQSGFDYPDLIPLPDGGYFFTYTANTKPFTGNLNDPYNGIFAWGRANAQGDTLWLKMYADTSNGGFRYSMTENMFMDSIKNLYIQGHVLDSGSFLPTMLITDSNGQIKSKRSYKAVPYVTGNHWMAHTVKSPYNTFVHFGSMEFTSIIPGIIDTLGTYGWLMQTDSFGCLQPGCEVADSIWHYNPTAVVTTQDYERVVLYPNPASQSITLEGVTPGSRYDIVDMKGTSAGSGIIQGQHTVINVESLVPGIYIIRIQMKDKPLIQLRLAKG